MNHLTPPATFTAPGLCHHLDVSGHPHAGPVTYRSDGFAQVPLDLGALLGGDAVIEATSEEYLTELVDAALTALTFLSMAHRDRPACAA